MRPQHWISIIGIGATVMIALQGATFVYVLKVEERLTRLETLAALQQNQLALQRGVRPEQLVPSIEISPAARMPLTAGH